MGVPALIETFGGKRHYYFYVAADTDVPAIISAVARRYPKEHLSWTVRPDPQWGFFERYAKEYFTSINEQRECTIPKEALADPNSRELLRAWVANQALHVSLFIPDEWQDPGHWGVALADVARQLADAYHESQGTDRKLTIQRIQAALAAELSDPTDTLTGGFVEE